MTTELPTEKPCSKCRQVKPLEQFSRQALGKYGRTASCKECVKAATRARYAANPDKYRAKIRSQYAANPERYREASRRWRRDNQEQARTTSRQNEARRKAVRVATDLGDVDDRAARLLPGPCYLCGRPLPDDRLDGRKVHLDHVVPLQPRPGDPQGVHCMDNLRPVHKGCNLRKHDAKLADLAWYSGPTDIGVATLPGM